MSGCSSHIVDIPFADADLGEAVAQVEAVGVALLQCADVDGKPECVGLVKHHVQYAGADAQALAGGAHLQVVQQQPAFMGLHHDKTYPFACGQDMAGAFC